jgi:hypothetical protein
MICFLRVGTWMHISQNSKKYGAYLSIEEKSLLTYGEEVESVILTALPL